MSKSPSTEETPETDKIVVPVDLFEKDPLELAKSPEDIARLVTYYRQTRENIRAAEAAGKAATKKAALTKAKPRDGTSVIASVLASTPSQS